MVKIIPLEKAENVRDLGGYKTPNGTVKFNKVVRGASLSDLSVRDREALQQYGVTDVVDFRSPSEAKDAPDKKIPTAKEYFLPVFGHDETKASISPQELLKQLEQGMTAQAQMIKVYRHFIEDEHAKKAYQEFLQILLANSGEQKSVLFHCTAGKDRTGFGAALVLDLLGVEQQTIMTDYLATNQYLNDRIANMTAAAKKQGAPELLVNGIEALMKADEAYLNESYTAAREHYGSLTNYAKEGLGFTTGEISDLKKLYLTK